MQADIKMSLATCRILKIKGTIYAKKMESIS